MVLSPATVVSKLKFINVNIGTDGRLIWTRVHRELFQQRPKEFDFMPPGKTYVEEFAAFLAAKCATLGAAGQSAVEGSSRCDDHARVQRAKGSVSDSTNANICSAPGTARGHRSAMTLPTAKSGPKTS